MGGSTLPMLERRFVIVAGKGGVGKSTVAAALAMCAARQGKRVLVAELGQRERVARLLGHPRGGGYAVTRVRENIDVINVRPQPALHEYGLIKLRLETLYKVVFENAVMQALTRVIPGMNELLLIGKAWHLEQEIDPRTGRYRWDMIIVDAPATGHGISLLDLPHVVTEAVKVGPMAEETRRIRDMLTDPGRSVMNIVTLPEEMPVNETIELERRMSTSLKIAPGHLFVNGLWPAALSSQEQTIMQSYCARSRCVGRFEGVLETLRFMEDRRRAQQVHLEALSARSPMPQIPIPYEFTPHFDCEAIERISLGVEEALRNHGRQATHT